MFKFERIILSRMLLEMFFFYQLVRARLD